MCRLGLDREALGALLVKAILDTKDNGFIESQMSFKRRRILFYMRTPQDKPGRI